MKTESEKRKLVCERLIKLSNRAMDSRGRFEKAYEKAISQIAQVNGEYHEYKTKIKETNCIDIDDSELDAAILRLKLYS